MSKEKRPAAKKAAPAGMQSKQPAQKEQSLSPLLNLMGRLEGLTDTSQLLDDLIRFFPQSVMRMPCVGAGHVPWAGSYPFGIVHSSWAGPLGEGGEKTYDLSDRSDMGKTWLVMQDTFDELQKYYPLRAAALYLRVLCRILVELVEDRQLDIMRDDAFIRSYLDGLLHVDAITARCEDCSHTDAFKKVIF